MVPLAAQDAVKQFPFSAHRALLRGLVRAMVEPLLKPLYGSFAHGWGIVVIAGVPDVVHAVGMAEG